jgi:hypothetical protein
MSSLIVVEALVLVTWWGLRDRLSGRPPPAQAVRQDIHGFASKESPEPP